MNQSDLIVDLHLVPLHPWWTRPTLWLALIALLLVFGAAVLALRYRPKKHKTETSPPPIPDWEMEFRRRLEKIRSARASLSGYQLAIATTQWMREYFWASRQWSAPTQTSHELMASELFASSLDDAQRLSLREMLNLADRIKFARHGATPGEQDHLLTLAERQLQRPGTSVHSASPKAPATT